jgi:hypothetical protein
MENNVLNLMGNVWGFNMLAIFFNHYFLMYFLYFSAYEQKVDASNNYELISVPPTPPPTQHEFLQPPDVPVWIFYVKNKLGP